jgi:putative aldouronate transport system permease protein
MRHGLAKKIIAHKFFYLMILPGAALVFLFSYLPLAGLFMAFVDFRPQLGNFWPTLFRSKFVGLEWFRYFFAGQDFFRVMRNTLASSVLSLSLGSVAAISFAIMLNECRGRLFKRVAQTASYLPYFVSWVIAANIIVTLLSAGGALNQALLKLGLVGESVMFLQDGRYFWGVIAASNTWKDMGYNAIMYLAAITAISAELFEAAQVDGAGRLRQIWHILLPSLRPTIVILLILNIGNLLNTGFDQYFLLGNPLTREFSDVIDTYSFRYGIQNGAYSYATAVSLFKSAVAFLMVLGVNQAAKAMKTSHLF